MNVILRHSYKLTKEDDIAVMEKTTVVYDTQSDEEVIITKLEVIGDSLVRKQEYFPETGSFLYEYTSYQEQEYFMYKGTMLNENTYLRQTVEYYIPQYEVYVSYDFKEDGLEDYRVKFFEDGHRVVKIDVNVFKTKPSINELTWNMLSIDNWNSVQYFNEELYIYKDSLTIMDDYELDIQLNGYGKIIAYKLFEGDLADLDITLNQYGLDSGYTLINVKEARTYFVSNYESKMANHGWIINDPINGITILNSVENKSFQFEQFIHEHN